MVVDVMISESGLKKSEMRCQKRLFLSTAIVCLMKSYVRMLSFPSGRHDKSTDKGLLLDDQDAAKKRTGN